MAYILKTTGLATKLVACLAVDEDGVTVKDFKAGNTGTYHASIAAPKTGTATWKGVTRNWFKTDYGADQFSPQGFAWSGTLPALPSVNGFSFFCAAEALTDAGSGIFWDVASGGATGIITSGTSVQTAKVSGSLQGSSNTPLPTATKISFGAHFKNSATALQFFYGLESGALAADGTYNDGNFLGAYNLMQFGGSAGLNSKRGRYFIACWFTDTALLTEAEFQSLHNDWFGTLFEATTTPFSGTGIATVLSARAVVASGAFGLVYRITGTMVDPSTGAPRANLTGIDAAFFDESNPSGLTTPRQTITNLTTDGSGNFTWSLPNSTLVAGQTGLFVARHAALGYLGAYRVTLVA